MGQTKTLKVAGFAAFGAFLVIFSVTAPLYAKAPDAGARANWLALSAELVKEKPNPAVLKALTNKSVFLKGELTGSAKAGLRVVTDSGVECVVLNPMRIDTGGREEVTVAVSGRVQSVDALRRTVNVKAVSVEVV